MERFSSIYPFTTENIAGYMSELDLKGKKVITVTGSTDHIINAIVCGTTDITTFDINPLTKCYMDLKLQGIRNLSYEDFLKIFLYDDKNLDSSFISDLEMSDNTKDFWIQQLLLHNNNWNELKKSNLFYRKYFNPNSKLEQNLYLDKDNYRKVQQIIDNVTIKFISKSLVDLNLKENYDYMFLSNISDYLNLMYNNNHLGNYRDLIYKFLNNVQQIYFAYLYDIKNNNPRSDIDNLEKVKKVFECFEIKTFKSALESQEEKTDGVLILRR